jgi:predicted nucleic acid-binding protein
MRLVVDTNIAFSAILNTNSKIAKIILKPKSGINFYSTDQLQIEIGNHWNKLKRISGYTEAELFKVVALINQRIRFINVELIPIKFLLKAENTVSDIDIDDAEFVALTEHIKGKLWTGDKDLIKGLKKKGWDKIITTDSLYKEVFKTV